MANTRSSLFRYVHADGLVIQFNGNQLILKFGVKEDMAANSDDMFEEVGVILDAERSKFLAHALTEVLRNYEEVSGNVIPVDPKYVERIEAAIKNAAPAAKN